MSVVLLYVLSLVVFCVHYFDIRKSLLGCSEIKTAMVEHFVAIG